MICYKKLWKMLIDKGLSSVDLRDMTKLAPNTITKLKHNEPVSLNVLERICVGLNCDFSDIVEHVEDE